MAQTWPVVRLGDVLNRRKEFVTISDIETYRRPRVQLHAQGIVERDAVPGALIKTKRQQVCRAGEFLVAEIDAKVGGFGLVPQNLDGCLVSSHYFLFEVDQTRLDRSFLGSFIQTPAFRDQVEAQGSTNYAAIRPADVLRYEIPLPSLPEQRRLVARIEELAARIQEARGLRRDAITEGEALAGSWIARVCAASICEETTIGQLVGKDGMQNGKSVKASGLLSSTHCLTLAAMRNGRIDVGARKAVPLSVQEAERYYVARNDVFIMRGNGSKSLCGRAGLVSEDATGVIFPDLLIRLTLPLARVAPEFFVAVWNSTLIRGVIEEKARTTSGIWKINQKHIGAVTVPLPSIPDQRRIVAELHALRAALDGLKQLQANAGAELDALLPSILDSAFKGGV